MPDGKHCPACGADVGYWAVARGLFRIRCPHCRARLSYTFTPRMSRVTTAVAVGCVLGALVAAFFVARAAFWSVGLFGAVASALGVLFGLAFTLGAVFQALLAPVLRRTQQLAVSGEEDEADEELW